MLLGEDGDKESFLKAGSVSVEEVADAVVFLASPKASYITANVLSINGGLYS